MIIKAFVSIVSVGVILLALSLGCGFGKTCTGRMKVDGQTFSGSAQDEATAKVNTCSKYCIEGTKEFEELYESWLISPKGKESYGRNDKWAALEDPKVSAFVDTCTSKCVKDAEKGLRSIETECR